MVMTIITVAVRGEEDITREDTSMTLLVRSEGRLASRATIVEEDIYCGGVDNKIIDNCAVDPRNICFARPRRGRRALKRSSREESSGTAPLGRNGAGR
jgi:hypothetical protein